MVRNLEEPINDIQGRFIKDNKLTLVRSLVS